MNRTKMKLITSLVILFSTCITIIRAGNPDDSLKSDNRWKSPPEEVMKVLNAPKQPLGWTSPTGSYMLLLDPLLFPPLAELAAPMHKLAGIRVNPNNNYFQNSYGAKNPRLVRISDGKVIPLELPLDLEVIDVLWTANGYRYVLTVKHSDHIGLWVGNTHGTVRKLEGILLNPS